MKLAVMSDIHSNIIALEECLSYIEKHPVDGVILLGDYVSDCPDPLRTLNCLKQLNKLLPLYCVRGNREEYFLRYRDGLEGNWTCSSYKGSLLYTYKNLREEDLNWFDGLPSTDLLRLNGTDVIRLAHGSPACTRELLDKEKDNTKKCMESLDTKYLLAGHTHRQMFYEYKGKKILNPGSVGVAIGVKAKAHMAYIKWEAGEWKPELLSIPFSFEEVRSWFKNSSLCKVAHIWPFCILKSMETGINMGPICAKRAHDAALAEKALDIDGNAAEIYWERAAKEIGVI